MCGVATRGCPRVTDGFPLTRRRAATYLAHEPGRPGRWVVSESAAASGGAVPKRWVVASVVALFVVTATVVVLATNGTAGPEATVGPNDGQAATTPPMNAPPSSSASTTSTTTVTSSTTAPSTSAPVPVAAPSDATLAGRIKPGVTRSGVATFYDTDGGGACGYDPSPDPLTAAMNGTDYEVAKACGAYVLVQAANGASVTVRVTNLCPPPCRGRAVGPEPGGVRPPRGTRPRGEPDHLAAGEPSVAGADLHPLQGRIVRVLVRHPGDRPPQSVGTAGSPHERRVEAAPAHPQSPAASPSDRSHPNELPELAG